ncbi:MFS transporter [Chitiniphilus shinanonensis]|uniref:MFS transporter n=1 Tax=Chitiniphilus shinanonensis TaxID=553088 RepID=A0ABQ6BZR4_9NEIS|nr:MFS transporter [Chitiniphilus shinanonensis]GLS06026.1 MFS transporter [Chitiniphilus shinanonensis]
MNRARIALFLASRAASTLGDQMLMFAVPLIVYRATGSVSMSGLAFLCEWLPRVISLPLAGVLADRVGGARVYVVADSVRAVACLLAAWTLTLAPQQAFAVTALLMALCAFCYAQAFIALEATVPLLVSKADMPKAQSTLQGINYGAGVAGPALAGVLMLWLAPAQLLWAAAVVFALSACGVRALRAARRIDTEARRESVLAGLATGWRVLRDTPLLVALVGLSLAVNLVVGLALATGAAITVGRFGLPDQAYASLQMSVGVLSIASFLLVPWLLRRCSVYRLGVFAFVVIALGGLVMGLAHSYPVFVAGYALSFALCGLFNVFIRTERLHWIPQAQLGRAIGLIVLLNQLSLPLAGLLVSVVGDRVPVQQLYLAVATVALVTFVVLRRFLQRHSRTALPPDLAPKAA